MIELLRIFTVIISKFALFKIKQEILFLNTFKFSLTPEVFYAVYMIFTVSKFIFRVLHPVVLFGSVIY